MHEQAFLSDAHFSSWTPVIVLDISVQGIRFATPGAVVGGELRHLRFRLPGNAQLHHASVRIVHRTSSGAAIGYTVGAVLEEIDAETRNAIMAFVGESAEA